MGLATIDPHSQKEHAEICLHFHTFLYKFVTFLNACISDKTSLINTKLGDFGNLGVLFLTMGINWFKSHNLQTRT